MPRPPAIFRIGPYAASIDERIASVEVALVECIDPVRDDIEWFPQCVELYDTEGAVVDVGTVNQLATLADIAWQLVEDRTPYAERGDHYRVQIRPAVLVERLADLEVA